MATMERRRNVKAAAKVLPAVALLLITILPAGCSQHKDIEFSSPYSPRYINPPQHAAAPTQTRDGSLYVDGSRVATVADHRARNINDLVTVKIVESTTAANSATVSTQREDTGQRGISTLLGLEKKFPTSWTPSSLISGDNNEEFDSQGSNMRTERITSTMTARVIERLPNGNLVIQGVRELIVNHERQTMLFQGIIRPVDIDERNTILSTQVADLQIRYSGSGVLTENLRRGWFSRLVNYVWPF